MAVDTFIWIYAVTFGIATIVSVSLLIAAARRIGKKRVDQ